MWIITINEWQKISIHQFLHKNRSLFFYVCCLLDVRLCAHFRSMISDFKSQRNLEAVFRTGMSSDFFGDFRPYTTRENKKLIGNERKNTEIFWLGILLPSFIDFWTFSVGIGPYVFNCALCTTFEPLKWIRDDLYGWILTDDWLNLGFSLVDVSVICELLS